jgi:hypothetical protein
MGLQLRLDRLLRKRCECQLRSDDAEVAYGAASPSALSELKGVITAPVLCKLPQAGSGAELSGVIAIQILDKPGYDAASGLLLSPRGGPYA